MRIAMVLLAGAAAFAFQSENQPSGTIAGQVVNQATGAPLQNAIIKLRYVNAAAGDEIMVRQTNDAGRFSFAGLWGRDWELSAECRGFASAWYHASRYVPQGRFSLEKNQQLNDIVIKLVAQTVITGKVLDPEGGPVEGVQVTLLKSGYSNGLPRWTEVASAITLDNGEYRIPRVSAGHYLVKAVVPTMERMASASGVETGYAATFHPETSDVAQAAQVDVADGAEIGGIDIHLVAVRLYHVRGRFQPPTENGTGNITLVDRADPRNIVARGLASPPDYIFDVQRVPPGSYLATGEWIGPTSTMYIATQGVDVVGPDIGGLALAPARSDEVTGSLKPKSDDRPVNLQKITISITRLKLGMVPIDKGTFPTYADADGNFRRQLYWDANFAGLAVSVSDLPGACYVDSIRYGGRDVPDSGIEYIPGATLEIIIGADGGRIDGTAAGSDDQPRGGAVVALLSSDGKSSPKSMQADAQGAFHFSAVPPGDYKLLAWDDVSRDDLENPAFARRFDSQATAITLAASGTVAASVKLAK
jgi:protocatechuate 3,4-dioxygenase beta subunit